MEISSTMSTSASFQRREAVRLRPTCAASCSLLSLAMPQPAQLWIVIPLMLHAATPVGAVKDTLDMRPRPSKTPLSTFSTWDLPVPAAPVKKTLLRCMTVVRTRCWEADRVTSSSSQRPSHRATQDSCGPVMHGSGAAPGPLRREKAGGLTPRTSMEALLGEESAATQRRPRSQGSARASSMGNILAQQPPTSSGVRVRYAQGAQTFSFD
eukprot:CAMPEP_0173341998 /NCGR_PEP_ID=MMETSP1144-20121109/9925_1 /TAXON_ID=483371 /ORGANISM="non described non described, Strain CCMP2298" /LENGTH=209 /DNA_ID=CAMNT_0014288467 /DNA_START=1421 /DNA_END=2051 /DNA_ORIENTATION=+